MVRRLPRVVPEGRRFAARSTTSWRTFCSRIKDFGEAAKQYERTAYGYPQHARSADAGYAAVYAYRQQLKVAGAEQQDAVKRDTVASSLKFADAFPKHEHAAPILGAAADDMYEMKDYRAAVEADSASSSITILEPKRESGVPLGLSLRTARSNSPTTRRPNTAMPRCWRSRRRVTSRALRSSTTSRPRSTSRVNTQTRRRTIARLPITS